MPGDEVAIEMTDFRNPPEAETSPGSEQQPPPPPPPNKPNLYGRVCNHWSQWPIAIAGTAAAIASAVVVVVSFPQSPFLSVGLGAAGAMAVVTYFSCYCVGREAKHKKIEELVKKDLQQEVVNLTQQQNTMSQNLQLLIQKKEELGVQLEQEKELTEKQKSQIVEFQHLNEDIKNSLVQYKKIEEEISQNLDDLGTGIDRLDEENKEAEEHGQDLEGQVGIFDKENDETKLVLARIEDARRKQVEVLKKVDANLKRQKLVAGELSLLFKQKQSLEETTGHFTSITEHLEQTTEQVAKVIESTEELLRKTKITELAKQISTLERTLRKHQNGDFT